MVKNNSTIIVPELMLRSGIMGSVNAIFVFFFTIYRYRIDYAHKIVLSTPNKHEDFTS